MGFIKTNIPEKTGNSLIPIQSEQCLNRNGVLLIALDGYEINAIDLYTVPAGYTFWIFTTEYVTIPTGGNPNLKLIIFCSNLTNTELYTGATMIWITDVTQPYYANLSNHQHFTLPVPIVENEHLIINFQNSNSEANSYNVYYSIKGILKKNGE